MVYFSNLRIQTRRKYIACCLDNIKKLNCGNRSFLGDKPWVFYIKRVRSTFFQLSSDLRFFS